ncbi:MAG: InlB B-repeat-containing protein, partial [Eubacteriales bacterium]|nr:InlB B-repeat-containing protein [Eubacteriales bacterium]
LEPTIEDDLPSFSSYDEAKDGRLWRITNRVITIEYRYSIDKNTIQFNPNGGAGSFSPMTHCYGYTLTLPDDTPTKAGYVFLGWRDSGDGKLYLPGESYVLNGNRTLTAVWSRENYDFAITELSLSATKLSPYGVVTVTVKLANQDATLSYRGIPVTLLYDGNVLTTRNIDFSAGGVQTLIFSVSVGQAEGDHTVTAHVNWADRAAEKQPDDNEQSATLTVQTEDYAQAVETVTPNGEYIAGDEVITAFLVYHDGTNDILPSMGNRATLTVYTPDGTILMTKALENIAVPAGKCNLIWFRWTVPVSCAGQSLRLECTVNADGVLPEDDKSNNTATVWVDVKERFISVTPDPTFDGDSLTELPTAPSGFVGRVRWNEWVYTEGGFVLKEYSLTLSGTAIITPNTGGDILRSGGGFYLTVTPTISGDIANATDAQSIFAAFPEFSYRTGTGECRTLEQMPDGRFCFPVHPSASARVHFLPLGIADGTYTVFLQLSGLWTPAGQVSATVTVSIPIAGTVYDGFYIR